MQNFIFICKYASIHMQTYIGMCVFYWYLQIISWLDSEYNLGSYADVL